MMIFILGLVALLVPFIDHVIGAPQATTSSTPNLRIEGLSTTIFEGPISSGPRNITAVQSDAGLTHYCDGLNENANPSPFNTALDALDAASKGTPSTPAFTYTVGYDGDLSDFYVLSIAGEQADGWGMLYNWQISTYGDGFTIAGCRQEVHTGDDVLWAYNVNQQTSVFLKVVPQTVTVAKGKSVTYTITDGLSGRVQPSATIHGVQANAQGKVTVTYPSAGYFPFKAKQTGAVRSELVKVTVTG